MTQLYLVTGVWLDDHGSFAESCHADSPKEAETKILEQHTGEDGTHPGACLIVAAIVTLSPGGELMVVA